MKWEEFIIKKKYQMPLFTTQPSSSLQAERLSHYYSIPLSCANINYKSASSDMPPSKPI